MDRLSRVRVDGPLAPYAVGFGESLVQQGYSQWTAIAHLQFMECVSRWLAARGMDAAGLTDTVVDAFLAERRASGQVRRLTRRGMIPLLGYLRASGAAPRSEPVPLNAEPLERLLAEFTDYLLEQRGLAPGTAVCYRRYAARLLSPHENADGVALGALTAGDVTSYVLSECGHRGSGSIQNVTVALRALLRFLHGRGRISGSMVDAVPAAVGWRRRSFPPELTRSQVARLLDCCDRNSAAGRRDYAILVLLARLGLRAGEVAALTIDDVDWRSGELAITGKGNRREPMPLPVDVGQALADYCRRGRPVTGCRNLLLQARAPYAALSSSTVGKVVERACGRADLPVVGPHRLRHAAATALRQTGAPAAEIGQILRHQHAATTTRYGSVDVAALAAWARPWPAGAR
jgi:integrase